jgi:hypothetical protein
VSTLAPIFHSGRSNTLPNLLDAVLAAEGHFNWLANEEHKNWPDNAGYTASCLKLVYGSLEG